MKHGEIETASLFKISSERLEHLFQGAAPHPGLEPPVTRLVRRIAVGQILPGRARSPDHETRSSPCRSECVDFVDACDHNSRVPDGACRPGTLEKE